MNVILTTFFFGVFTNIGLVQSQCRHGWVPFEESCYLFTDLKEPWNQAEIYCNIFKSSLAEITSKEENDFIKGHLQMIHANDTRKDSVYWLGASDFESEGEWRWIKTDEPLTGFNDWAPGQPDNWRSVEDCLEIHRGFGYKWDDHPCDIKLFFICEMEEDIGSQVIG